jgi:lipoyl synthase
MKNKHRRHPDWLKVPIPGGKTYAAMKEQLRNSHLHTICEEAKCPNQAECFGNGVATFLILGDRCTRNCRYCHVTHATPFVLNENEPYDVAISVQQLGLSYVVITSVTRDDLSDGGASVYVETITKIKEMNPGCKVEVLIPDFKGNQTALMNVLQASPDVLNHNIEVVKALFPSIRPEGNYERSITLLKQSKTEYPKIPTKSGFMVGLGETEEQIDELLHDLRKVQVDMLTIGQYLQPSKNHAPIHKYYTPTEFDLLKEKALTLGFAHVESGPLVRSSYHAEQAMKQM